MGEASVFNHLPLFPLDHIPKSHEMTLMDVPKKKLLLISHAFHQRTKSNEFLIDLFGDDYELTCRYLDPTSPDPDASLADVRMEDYELIVCSQVEPPQSVLGRRSKAPLIFVPMYDFSESWEIERWFPFRKARIISFSRALAGRLERWGFDVKSAQYFPEPSTTANWGKPEKAFFWNRIEAINLRMASTLLDSSPVTSIHVHRSMDPGQVYMPPDNTIKGRFSITETEWFETREELREVLEDCSVYIAPRRLEGVGLSFLEAMAMGRCVVAPDRPTMNEYIRDGETGILYDPDDPRPILLGDLRGMQQRALASIQAGRAEWSHQKATLLAWCRESATPRVPLLRASLLKRLLAHPIKGSRPWRRWLISVRVKRGQLRIRCLGRIIRVGKPTQEVD